MSKKNEPWNLLRRLGVDKSYPRLISGDFNKILYFFEKVGGVLRDDCRMQIFRKNVLNDCELIDVGYSGTWYTWERGNLSETNIRQRLDRGVANDAWFNLFPEGKIRHLPNIFLDHCPLLIDLEGQKNLN